MSSEVTITTNNIRQLNINNTNNNNSCQLMSKPNTPSILLLEPVAPDNLAIEIVADQENNPELASLTDDTWLQEYNFLDIFDAVINNSNDITAFPVEVEVNPVPLVLVEPEKEKPSPNNILEQAIGETLYPVDNISIEVIDHAE